MIWPWWHTCRYVYPDGRQCKLPSRWYIIYGPDEYYDNTVRCDLHVETVSGRRVRLH